MIDMPFADFTTFLDSKERKYSTLCRYRKILIDTIQKFDATDKTNMTTIRVCRKKLKYVEGKMQLILTAGVPTKRRKAGTGKKVEVEHIYKDTAQNRKSGRVGQTYMKVTYEDAEFEDVKREKMRRRRRRKTANSTDASKNKWILAVAAAKKDIGAPNFVIVRREVKEPGNTEQEMGVKVYNRAKEIMIVLKEEELKNKESALEAVVDTDAMEVEGETPTVST
jgi:hypothetical protein